MRLLARLRTLTVGILASALAVSGSNSQPAAEPRAVVELFTSQGCSTCPPADAYLSDLAQREDVLALSYHVDYWDYLGWKDTLGSSEHSARQRAYAARRGDRRVYTPQMIVNGEGHIVGGDRDAVEAAIETSELPVAIDFRKDDELLTVKIGKGRGTGTIWLAHVVQKADVKVERGENRGRTMHYVNAVTEMRPVGVWEGEPVSLKLPARVMPGGGSRTCAIILQESVGDHPGRILGATLLIND